MENTELLSLAGSAEERAYAPYSGVRVGAALLTRSGKIYLGANIENSAFSPSLCAERVAFSAALMAGERDFVKIAVTASKGGRSLSKFPPCGVCRQVMAEFCTDDFEIILEESGAARCYSLPLLLPNRFDKMNL